MLDVRLYRRPGYTFGELRRGSDRADAVIAVGKNRDEALIRAGETADLIEFEMIDAEAARLSRRCDVRIVPGQGLKHNA